MRILFLEVDTQRTWAVASIGPAYLAAWVRRFGHEVSLLRINEDAPVDDLARAVEARRPDVIGVSLTSRQWLGARRLLNGVRERMTIPVVAGGLHPTFAPDATLSIPGIDYICLGEGERAFLYLVEALDAGVAITDGSIDNIQVNPGATNRPRLGRPFEPIDDLPFMARDMLDEQHGVVHMCTQRGCPFPCTYCAARMFDQLYAPGNPGSSGDANLDDSAAGNQAEGHPYGRRRSHENVLAELRAIADAGPLNYIIFLDDTFTIHHPWVHRFCDVYGHDFGVPFSLHARIETMNEKLIDALADAGCRHIVYGVESGSERVRREIMKRPVTDDKIARIFALTRAAGIIVTANYMLGIPGETVDEMRQTLALHQRLAPDDFGYFVFYPYPGTALFQECRDKGYLPDDYLERPARHRESILDLPGVTRDEITAMYQRWTEVRATHAATRYGPEYARRHGEAVAADIQACAEAG